MAHLVNTKLASTDIKNFATGVVCWVSDLILKHRVLSRATAPQQLNACWGDFPGKSPRTKRKILDRARSVHYKQVGPRVIGPKAAHTCNQIPKPGFHHAVVLNMLYIKSIIVYGRNGFENTNVNAQDTACNCFLRSPARRL